MIRDKNSTRLAAQFGFNVDLAVPLGQVINLVERATFPEARPLPTSPGKTGNPPGVIPGPLRPLRPALRNHRRFTEDVRNILATLQYGIRWLPTTTRSISSRGQRTAEVEGREMQRRLRHQWGRTVSPAWPTAKSSISPSA